ncbi:MAG: type II secretion system protein, partial [Longimicrobiales bacterium]
MKRPRSASGRRGFTFLEVAVTLSVLGVLTVPLVGAGVELRSRSLLRTSVEGAAGLLTRARWAAVALGGSTVEFRGTPPTGTLLSPGGDTLFVQGLGEGGVALALSRERPRAESRFGPLGLGIVASQTLRFTHHGN